MDVRAYPVGGPAVRGHRLGLTGTAPATFAWGYSTIGTLAAWTVAPQARGAWSLSGTFASRQPDYFFRQRPILFTVPRRGGFWTWLVREIRVGPQSVVATLGPMEA